MSKLIIHNQSTDNDNLSTSSTIEPPDNQSKEEIDESLEIHGSVPETLKLIDELLTISPVIIN